MFASLRSAFTFLTTLPLGRSAPPADLPPGRMFSYFPLVGLVIGGIIALVALVPVFSKDLVACLVLVAWIMLTGGLHLDGLADSCDGLFATTSVERRLEIMKDPRTGSWAVIGLVVVLLSKWASLRMLPPLLVVLPPVLARWGMVLAVAGFPLARPSGSAAYFRAGFGRAQVILASVITMLLVIAASICIDWRLGFTLIIPPIMVWLIGRWAAGRLGGLTGDIYGALCELVELVCLLYLNTL